MNDSGIYALFADHKSTLKECSGDNSDGSTIRFMTESQIEAVNFDKFKTKYTNDLRLSEECAASTDALLQTDTGLAFVEFKNGKVNNRNVKDKIRDSLLLFCDFTQKTISYTREHVDFIVVYNEEKNPLPNQYKKQTNTDAPSRTEISRYFLGKGNQELILFDLERYQHLYFREVHTYTKEQFGNYIEKTLSGGPVS